MTLYLPRIALIITAFAAFGLAMCLLLIARELRPHRAYIAALIIAMMLAICGVMFLM